MPTSPLERMLDITTIYHEPDVPAYPRGQQVLERRPPRAGHQEEPDRPAQRPVQRLHRALDLERLRDGVLLLLVPRRKGYANPITLFVDIERILGYLERHAGRQGSKPAPHQCDPVDWVYDIGENGECSVDAAVSDSARDLVDLFARLPGPKASFATKFVNRDLLDLDPRGGTRVRFSLMP